jgi:hypothetical protein
VLRVKQSWEKENKGKRFEGYNAPTDWASATVHNNIGGGSVELLLCGLRFPSQRGLLDDLDVWIADSAATAQSTPHPIW